MAHQFEAPNETRLLDQLVTCGVPDMVGSIVTKSPYNKLDHLHGIGTLQLGRIKPEFYYPVTAIIHHERAALLSASFVLGLRVRYIEIFDGEDLRLRPAAPIGNIVMEMTKDRVGVSFYESLNDQEAFVEIPDLTVPMAISAAESVLMFTQRGLIKVYPQPEDFYAQHQPDTLSANV